MMTSLWGPRMNPPCDLNIKLDIFGRLTPHQKRIQDENQISFQPPPPDTIIDIPLPKNLSSCGFETTTLTLGRWSFNLFSGPIASTLLVVVCVRVPSTLQWGMSITHMGN